MTELLPVQFAACYRAVERFQLGGFDEALVVYRQQSFSMPFPLPAARVE